MFEKYFGGTEQNTNLTIKMHNEKKRMYTNPLKKMKRLITNESALALKFGPKVTSNYSCLQWCRAVTTL